MINFSFAITVCNEANELERLLNQLKSCVIENDEIIIQVKDEGIGFKEQEQEQVLKAFYRGSQSKGKPPGTGLGLHLVQNILKIYNGAILIRQNAPQGSIIEIRLPYHGKTQ
jgi:signal transduction histidine kinase